MKISNFEQDENALKLLKEKLKLLDITFFSGRDLVVDVALKDFGLHSDRPLLPRYKSVPVSFRYSLLALSSNHT